MRVSNPVNDNFYDLPFDGDQRFISKQRIYSINDNILERLNNASIVNVY